MSWLVPEVFSQAIAIGHELAPFQGDTEYALLPAEKSYLGTRDPFAEYRGSSMDKVGIGAMFQALSENHNRMIAGLKRAEKERKTLPPAVADAITRLQQIVNGAHGKIGFADAGKHYANSEIEEVGTQGWEAYLQATRPLPFPSAGTNGNQPNSSLRDLEKEIDAGDSPSTWKSSLKNLNAQEQAAEQSELQWQEEWEKRAELTDVFNEADVTGEDLADPQDEPAMVIEWLRRLRAVVDCLIENGWAQFLDKVSDSTAKVVLLAIRDGQSDHAIIDMDLFGREFGKELRTIHAQLFRLIWSENLPAWKQGTLDLRDPAEVLESIHYRDLPNHIPDIIRLLELERAVAQQRKKTDAQGKAIHAGADALKFAERLVADVIAERPDWEPPDVSSLLTAELKLRSYINWFIGLSAPAESPELRTLQPDEVDALRRADDLSYDPSDKDIAIVVEAIERAPGSTGWKGIGKLFSRMRKRKPTDERWLSPMRAAATMRHLAQKGYLEFAILDGREVVSVTDEGYLLGNDAKAKPAGVTPPNPIPPESRAGGEVDGQPLTVKFIKDVFGWDGSTLSRNVDRIANPDGRGHVYEWKSLCRYGKKRGRDVEAEYRKWQSSHRKVCN